MRRRSPSVPDDASSQTAACSAVAESVVARRDWLWQSLCGALGMSGCLPLAIDHRQAALKPALPPLVKPKDAITLEVYFIERAAGDPLLGETLWRDLDEIGAIKSAESRARLQAAGLRVGLGGSHAPAALRALINDGPSSARSPAAGYQPIVLLAGQESTLETAVIDRTFEIRAARGTGDLAKSYDGARCVLRLSAERQQEGWVRLRFQPELHYGPPIVQPTAGDRAWQLRQGQKIDALYEQRFDVELNLSEMVVIGAAGKAPDAIGARFFRSGEPPTATERIMVVRVADLQQIEPVRARDW